MKVDAHQHFWRYTPEQYRWIRKDVLKHDYMPADLVPLLAATGFEGTVAVQARTTVEETQWLLDLAEQYPFIVGVVGWLDVCGADLATQLARFRANPRFCGIRYGLQTDPDDPAKLRADFLRGMATLATFDVTFDLLIRPPQLALARWLVASFPTLRFVLDHIANPPIKEQVMSPWEEELRALAALPNVACKVSGMVTRADHDNWKPEDLHPYLDVVLDAFGPDRLLIGSDWPVCTQAATYAATMQVVTDYIAQLPEAAQSAILGQNVLRVYNILKVRKSITYRMQAENGC